MNKPLALKGKVVCDDGIIDAIVVINDGKISEITKGSISDEVDIIDFADHYILPSFIELHAHGGGGHDFIDNTVESLDSIFEAHLSHGVTTLCPTLCACDFGEMLKFLKLCRENPRPGFAGVHLEGPFLSPKMCGAQNLSCIVEPTDERIAALEEFSEVIARITAAPELAGADKLAERMTKRGILLSIGHSDAEAELAEKALRSGFSSVTHLFCSTSGRHKLGSYVHGGIIETALLNDDCYVELIGDGHHISRESLLLTLKCKGADRICLVSDAMRAAGSDRDGESYLGAILPENRVILEDGVAKLPDRSSFAGSLAVGDTMVKAICGGYGIPLPIVSKMMSKTPAKLLGLSDRGELRSGLRADITVLDKEYSSVAVFRKGIQIYTKR